MRSSYSRWVRGIISIMGLSVCLVFVCLTTTAGAAAPTVTSKAVFPAAAATGGSPPVIQAFKANPMTLETPTSAAVYTFKVKGATDVKINEAGVNVKSIDNPSGATLQGTADGNPASSISTDANGQFICTIVASNDGGSVQADLTLSLAKELLPGAPPPGSTGNQTKNKSRWLEQTGIQTTIPPASSTTNPNQPDFFKCPENCKYCLQPGDAANLGFTQRCSDQRCFYDADNKRSWYCYSEPVGWCCANQQVSQTTRSQCAQIGGYWSLNQYEAVDACQPRGFCCYNGQVYSGVTKDECAVKGGSYWSTSQADVMQNCAPPPCWCCVKGQVFQTTQDRCYAAGGACYATQSQAAAACYETPRPPTYLK
jgi:hypothetical protein